ncbi:MAG TPA: hypothetical protein VGG38_13070 [Acidimicrobiales bacterium]|jgi:hypothetical protein
MVLSFALGALVLALVLLRQMRIRAVPRMLLIRVPVIIGVIGIFELFGYAGDHHPTSADVLWVVGTLLIGAVAVGAARALTVRVWSTGQLVVRQGTPLTMVLWVVSLAVHLYVDGGGGHRGASGLEQASVLLYLALTIGVQNYVVYRRGLPLWEQLGPNAGRGFQFSFGNGPANMQTFFANFRNGPPGAGPSGPGAGTGPYGDSDIIDAEVVDDDDPPELHR